MATAADIIKSSLRLIGVIATGETPSASEQADALVTLNDLVDSWSNENLLLFSKVRDELTLVAEQQSYTMGDGGDFNTARPQKIENAILKYSSDTDIPIKIITQSQWAAIPAKTTTSTTPSRLFVNYEYPLAKLYFYPTPSEGKTLILWSWKPLTSFATAATEASLPPGYLRALRYNLAYDLAPEYGVEMSSTAVNTAVESKASIKRMNIKPQILGADSALRRGGAWDWRTGGL